MPVIGWDENSPSDAESAGLGDDRIRSLKTSLRVGLAGEHVWPSGSGDAGVHLLGSGRPYVGPQSTVSSAGTDGRLQWASDTSNFFHVGSGGTALIGGPRVLSMGSYPGALPQRHYWAMEFGAERTASNGSLTVTFPRSGFSGAPIVLATAVDDGGAPFQAITLTVTARTATYFDVTTWDDTGAGMGSVAFDWLSIGTRVL